jgi:hypothetical protein
MVNPASFNFTVPTTTTLTPEAQAITQVFDTAFNNTATKVATTTLTVASGATTVVSSVGTGFGGAGFAALRWF